MYTDPSGRIIPFLVLAGIGAIAGTAINFTLQMINARGNIKCVNWGEVAISAGAGVIAAFLGVYAVVPLMNTIGFVGLMGIGALVGGSLNIAAQSREIGPINLGEVAYSALTGAVVAGGIGIASLAISSLVGGIAAAIGGGSAAAEAACADGDCTNETELLINITDNRMAPNEKVVPSSIIEYFPPNKGFVEDPEMINLQKGQLLQRFGSKFGAFLTDVGTPSWRVSLPPGSPTTPTIYEVMEEIITVAKGPVASWFGQPGGGIQYYIGFLGRNIDKLVNSGVLKEIK